MAKKRVHEIAKERGIPTKEGLAVLQRAGLDVKAAASSVDETEVERAFASSGGNGADGESGAGAGAQSDGPPASEPAADSSDGPKAPKRQPRSRPVRGSEGGTGGSGGGGRRRRVVIDSQAGRDRPAPPPQRPPRRGRGRRRRPQWVEPDLTPVEVEEVEEPPTEIKSGATVKEVAESLGLSAPEVIKKLMELGEMATLTQTLTDEAIEVLAGGFDKKVDMIHAADEVEEEPEFDDVDDDLADRPPVV